MMMYLGTLGRMVAIKCPTTQRVAQAERYSFNTTLGGSVKAQAGPVGRRAWDIGLGPLSTPSDVGTLMDFTTGAWGSGPFWFVPADAPVVNVLEPSAASCDPLSIEVHDGAELLGVPHMDLGAEGVAARSLWKTDTGVANIGEPVPVVPGKPVTGTVWATGKGHARLIFLDAAGALITAVNSPRGTRSAPQRLSVTASSPGHAASVQLQVTEGVVQAARPALTWTDQPYEWGDGQGCPKAIIYSASRDVIKAWENPTTGRWSDVTFTVQEVG